MSLSKFNPDFFAILETVGSKVFQKQTMPFSLLWGLGAFYARFSVSVKSCGVGLPTKSISSHIMSERKPHIP